MSELQVVVAIPARNEAERIEPCLAALARQRDRFAAPLPISLYAVLLYADGCTDGTVAVAEAWAERTSFPLRVVVGEGGDAREAHAGHARRRAMDLAAEILEREGSPRSYILTTDADSCAASTWIDATVTEFARGVDAVAGYVDVHAPEMTALGAAFLLRSRLEDRYLRLVAEIYAICDPMAHDPWPNHRFASGASLAVSLEAYRAIGGLPAPRSGEDAALARKLLERGFRLRHALSAQVSTSCRFDGRAAGGTADAMRHRHATTDAVCDDELEPALVVTRRALLRGRRRRALAAERPWPGEDAYRPIRPAQLVRQIARAEMILARLRSGR